MTDLGDFDQCRSIRVESVEDGDSFIDSEYDSNVEVSSLEEEDGVLFRGSYCIAKFRPSLPYPPPLNITMDDVVINFNSSSKYKSLVGTVFEDAAKLAQGFYSLPIHIALCVPSTCSSNDITLLMTKLISPLHMTVSLDGNSCDTLDDTLSLSLHQKISLIILGILVLIVIFCTLIDNIKKEFSFTNLQNKYNWASYLKDKKVCKTTLNNELSLMSKKIKVTTVTSNDNNVYSSTVTFTSSSSSSSENCEIEETNSDESVNYLTKDKCEKINDYSTYNKVKSNINNEKQFSEKTMSKSTTKISNNDEDKKTFTLIIIESFSLKYNLKKLFSEKFNSTDSRIHFIHGTRVLTMLWIVICHTYTFGTQFLASIGSKLD